MTELFTFCCMSGVSVVTHLHDMRTAMAIIAVQGTTCLACFVVRVFWSKL